MQVQTTHLRRKTKRLHIRPLELTDFESWRIANQQMSEPNNKWDLGSKPKSELTKLSFRKLLNAQKRMRSKDSFYHLGVFDKKGLLVGQGAIMEVARGISQTAFLGYRIFNRYWGLGYGKEAVRAILEIGFDEIKLHRIEAGIEPQNVRSLRLAKSLGMRREGVKKRAVYLRHKWVDLVMYTLTCEDLNKSYDVSQIRRGN